MDFQEFRSTLGQHPIAYLSAEFALTDRLPIYAGGLGVLAGDIVRQANALELPFVAVGLLYREGYFKQLINLHGEQTEHYPIVDVTEAPIDLVVTTEGKPLLVSIPIQSTTLYFQVWEYLEGDVSVYLLDTDVPENPAPFRQLTRRLYPSDPMMRLMQEIVLGIGGVRTLMKLHIHPSIYHLNESHSALAIFEITHHYMNEYGMSFFEAYQYARQKIVFTNHTLIAAGNEVFLQADVADYLQEYARSLDLPIAEMLALGKMEKPQDFGLTALALHMACRVNTVSQLHSTMAKQLWPQVEMPGITNGVFLRSWVNADIKAQVPDFSVAALQKLSPKDLWRAHEMAKHRLIDEIRFRTGVQLSPHAMILTWSWRIASYKRPDAIFSDIKRLMQLVRNTSQPIQIILAGKAHPGDALMHQTLAHMNQLIKEHKLHGKVVYVPDYSLTVADVLVSGSDVWLNTPLIGQEASGTSGMKAGANGVLQLSVSDGWVAEIDLKAVGWELPNDFNTALYDLLEQDIIPLYYKRDADQLPQQWLERMRATMELIWTRFSAKRMVEDYIALLYRPALELESKDKHEHNWRRNYRTRHIA